MGTYWIHLANVLYLASYLVRDILWLRVLTVVAGSLLLPFYFTQSPPLWEAIAWNLLFISINTYQIKVLLLERRPVKLDETQQRLYQLVFRSLKPREFVKLLALGEWKEAAAEECIVAEGEQLDRMMVIFSGAAAVHADGKTVATLDDGSLVGEMSFITGEVPQATVSATERTRYVSWPKEPLQEFLKKNPELRAAWQMIIGADLAMKLRSA